MSSIKDELIVHLSIDIETYSSVDLKKSGLYKYVQSPDFQILLFAYSWDGEPVRVIDLAQGEEIPKHVLEALTDTYVIKHAFNAPFEWYCLSKHLDVAPLSWISQWRCTQVHGLYLGYPFGLAETAKAVGLPEEKQKMTVGNALIKLFCTPTKPTKSNGNRTRTLPHHEPEKWELFKEYNRQDVVTEMEIAKRFVAFPIPDQEYRLWLIDQKINIRGVKVDLDVVGGAIAIDDQISSELLVEAKQITGLANPNSGSQLRGWLESRTGQSLPNVQKETLTDFAETVTDPDVARVLEIRRELSKTSISKYRAMDMAVCDDGRLRGTTQFYGANRTGRWAGRIVQPQNLPRNYIQPLGLARQLVIDKKIDSIKVIFGDVSDSLSQLIRTALIPDQGKRLIVSDFSAIEARIIAWLAGEEWVLEVFRTHGKIYEAAASQMFGVPLDQVDGELRQKGKVATLALGYQGSTGALIQMGALRQGLSEDELPEIVTRWRNANRRIVDLWYSIDAAVLEVMRTGEPIGIRGLIIARESHFDTSQDFLTIRLPSGRKLYYVKPHLAENAFGREALHYWQMNQQTSKWEVTSTYGGKLTENITQAIARDCLAESIARLDSLNYQIVLHVHDEVVLEESEDVLNRVTEIMGQPIQWAPGLPLKAAGFICDFYQKD